MKLWRKRLSYPLRVAAIESAFAQARGEGLDVDKADVTITGGDTVMLWFPGPEDNWELPNPEIIGE